MRIKLAWVLLALLLASMSSASAFPFDSHLPTQSNKIDPHVLDDTSRGQTAHFLVIFRQQTNLSRISSKSTDRLERGRLIYQSLWETATQSQAATLAQLVSLGVRFHPYWIVNCIAVEGNRQVVEAMASRPEVAFIESNRTFYVPLEMVGVQWTGLQDVRLTQAGVEWNITWVNAPQVWDLGATGQGIVYANADVGVKWDHPALISQYRGWDSIQVNHNYNWWDAIHEDLNGNGTNPACGFSSPQPCADGGHGTHTTGTGVGSDGGENQIGMAPGARWIACRNMEENVGRPSTYIECMQFFLAPTDLNGENANPDLRPDVVGNSYGCPSSELCSPHSLQAAMENLRAAGVFMAVSAGNNGPGCSTVSSPPGLEDSAITVGATNFQSSSIASLSSRGPVTIDSSNRRKPDLVAPGVNVRSSWPDNMNLYTLSSGTSMAAPHVAGAVALLWSAFPDLRGNVDYTEYVLEDTALHLTTSQGCGGDGVTDIPNNVYGYGQIDVLAAYNELAGNPIPTPSPTPSVTPTPEKYQFFLPLIAE